MSARSHRSVGGSPLRLGLLSLGLYLAACQAPAEQLKRPEGGERSPPIPALKERLKGLGPRQVACLAPLILALKVPELSGLSASASPLPSTAECLERLSSIAARGPLILWARELLSIGGAWGQDTESSHELALISIGLSAEQLSELGVSSELRWSAWRLGAGLRRGSSAEAPPPLALRYDRLTRPAKPRAERGGWWAHLGLWLPAPHLGYELIFTHPKGWPVGAFGPTPSAERSYASLRERRWWIPPARGAHGRVLYLSLTPSWRQLSRWVWAQLVAPIVSLPLDERLSDGVDAALSGRAALSHWIQRMTHYRYSPLRRYQPRTPLQSLRLGHGDCKDLSALAYVLLRAAGQPSWFALTSQRPLLASARAVPSMGWFDHVLLWTPTREERAALLEESPSTEAPPVSSPLSSWFDPTAAQGRVQGMSGRWAYVLLGPERGRWLQIGGLSLSGASPKPQ